MARNPTFVNVITGATGSGKTTLIRALLALRPHEERWAVLTNDFGTATLGREAEAVTEHIEVREVAGCVCCTGQLVLRTALVSLVRKTLPHRVLIEASAAADPAPLFTLLISSTFASALEARAFITTAHVSQLGDARYTRAPVYCEQIRAADVVVLTTPEGTTAEEGDAACAALVDFISAGTPVVQDVREVGPAVLDMGHDHRHPHLPRSRRKE